MIYVTNTNHMHEFNQKLSYMTMINLENFYELLEGEIHGLLLIYCVQLGYNMHYFYTYWVDMKNSRSQIDLSNELMLTRQYNGYKLVRPKNVKTSKPLVSFGSLHKNTFNVFFMNYDSRVISVNDAQMKIFECNSINDMIGKDHFGLTPKRVAKQLRKNDLYVMERQTSSFYDENVILNDNTTCLNFLTIKYPWFDDNNEILGVLGFSVETNKQNLSACLQYLSQYGFLNTCEKSRLSNSGLFINDTFLTKREAEILYKIIRGLTAKQIGQLLCISHRTVEKHLINIKIKLKVSNKSELIDLVIDKLT